MSATAAFVNRLTINALESGSVSIFEVFAGINFNTSFNFAFDADAEPTDLALQQLFLPQISGYADPEVAVTSNWGDISVLGIGGNPAAASFANILSLNFNSMCVLACRASRALKVHASHPIVAKFSHFPAAMAQLKWKSMAAA